MMGRSLRGRLIRLLLGVLAPVWLLLAVASYLYMLQEVDELFDHQLEQVAATLFSLDLGQIQAAVDAPGLHAFNDDDAFAAWAWDLQGRPVFRSQAAPVLAFRQSGERLQTLEIGGQRWRVLWVKEPLRDRWLAVARPWYERDELATGLAVGLGSPWLLSLMVMVVLIWMAVGRGLAPLEDLSRQIAARRPEDLSPVLASAIPDEAQPLMAEINLLMTRLEAALENERRFTADASHELRTPLAAIRAQLEVAMAEPVAAARQHALAQALAGVSRATRLTEQLLLLARLDHLAAVPDAGVFDLLLLAREELADCACQAVGRGIELSLDGESSMLFGSASLLRLAVRNLLDNAVNHAPSGGHVAVSLEAVAGRLSLSVQDNGPGVPDAALARLGERFYRLDSVLPGSGLGLSIVRRVVALHGAELDFSNRGGLCVSLVFPVSASTA